MSGGEVAQRRAAPAWEKRALDITCFDNDYLFIKLKYNS
jgi:hypothetical protein